MVYRARDTRLDREVALKVLLDEVAGDRARLRRFEREARAASAISHPNILTVYDVGEHDGSPYVVTELLEGETLRERIARGRLQPAAALEVATRMARGLAAAHERGIVHRDLKPENVFLTREGNLKILDFGLVKLLPATDEQAPGTEPTAALTESMALLGTPAYMSPEQIGGRTTDFRTDQFALGCILYEMLTGGRPFSKESTPLTLAAIAGEDPEPLAARRPDLAPPVIWVVERCLAKEPEGRYAATADLAFDLGALRHHVDELASWTASGAAAPRRSRRWPLMSAAAVLALAAATVLWQGTRSPSATVPEVRMLTYSGRDSSPAASPDGRTIAFSSERDGRRRIWIKELASGAEVPLTEGPSDDLPRYSPDGSQLLFARQEEARTDLFRVPVVGGGPRRVVVDARAGDWMPGGDRVLFLRWSVEDGITRSVLGRVRADGGGEEVLMRFEDPLLHHPRVSPDGRRAALCDLGRSAGLPVSIWLADLEARTVAPLPGPPDIGPLSAPAWLGDGEAIAYARADSVSSQLVGGSSRVLVHRLGSARPRVALTASTSSTALAAVGPGILVLDGRGSRQNLRERRLDDGRGEARWLTRGRSGDRQPVYSPDGRWVAFSSRRGGSLDLWAVSTESGAVRRLTDDPAEDWDPGFTRDGRLLWSSNRSGSFEIWIAAADGTGPRRVTRGMRDAQNPTSTPDGEWIVFASAAPEEAGVYKVRLDGDELTRLVAGTIVVPDVSPDGRYVSYLANWGSEEATVRVLRLADGRSEPFAVELPYDPNPRGIVIGRSRWLPDGTGIAFVSQAEDGSYGVFLQPFEPGAPTSGAPRRLAGFDPELITESFAISPDGVHITLAQWDPVSSLLWAENVTGIAPPVLRRAGPGGL